MKLLVAITITAFFLFNGKAHAQETILSGTVKDSATLEPLEYVMVICSPEHLAITDANGSFRISFPTGKYSQFRVLLVGYVEKVIKIESTVAFQELDILLEASSTFLDPIVISGSKSGERQVMSTVSIQSIQPYLIRNRITTNMQEVIGLSPGVSITDGQANIRSGSGWSYGTGSRVALMVDGMPMMGAGTGQVLWNYLPIENVEQVEVIKGASSVLYGSAALNGVINIRTKWPGNKELISASVFSGVYDAPRNDAWKWQGKRPLLKNGAHFLYGNGNDRYQYVFSTHLLKDDSYRMGDIDNRARISGKTRFYSKNKKLYGGVNGAFMKAHTASFLLWESYNLALTGLDSAATENQSTRWNIDPYLVIIQGGFVHHLNTRALMAKNDILNEPGQQDQDNSSMLYYAEYRLEANQLKKYDWLLNAGAVASYGKTKSQMFDGDKDNSNIAAYLQADYQGRRLTLSLGVRYEYYRLEQYTEKKPVYKSGINYKLWKATYLRASAGQGYRFPAVSEKYIRTSVGAVSIFPNAGLKSEFGTNAEIGVRQGLRLGKIDMLLDAAFYTMKFDNMMEFSFGQWQDFTPSNPGFGFKSVNVGETRIDGMEISLAGTGKWNKSEFKGMLAYNYSNPVNLEPDWVYAQSISADLTYKTTSSDSTGTILKYRNRHLFKADMQWEMRRWTVGTSYQYTSAIEAIDKAFLEFPINIVSPGIAQARADFSKGAHVIDFRASYAVTSDYKVSLMINNVLNSVYMTRPCDIRPSRMYTVQLSFRY